MSPPVLEVAELRGGYGPTRIVEGVSLVLPERGDLALLGRNGAGKTTLINTITGRLRLQGGAVRVAGREMGRGWTLERV